VQLSEINTRDLAGSPVQMQIWVDRADGGHRGFFSPELLKKAEPAGRLVEVERANLRRESITMALASYLLRNYAVMPMRMNRDASLSKDKVRKIVDYIASNLAEHGSLQELADLVEMSPFHFCRSFKQSAGLTPHQYILHVRIKRAKGLLKNKKLGIAEIASRLGFSDQSHFTNIFRRLAGTTPARWRASL